MKVEVTDQEGQKKRLEFEIPQDVVTDELGKVYRQINATAKLKGFRPGKIPRAIIKRFFWPQIEAEVIQKLIPIYYRQAISEAALEPVGEPAFDDFFLEEGKPLPIRVTLEVKPVLEPKDYIGIEVNWQKPEAKDEDVADMLARLQEKNAQFEVAGNRPVQEGDVIVLAYDGTMDGSPIDKKRSEDLQLEIRGGDEKNDFTNALVGLSKGEAKKIEVTLPEDFPQKEMRGKKAILDVTIKEIKEKRLPPLDDEFARDLGDYDDLDALKKQIRNQIQTSLDRQAENIAREEAVNILMTKNPFEPSETMIESRLNEMIASLEHQIRLDDEDGNRVDWDSEKFREEFRPKAEKDVHLSLILEGIARKEGLSVSEGEIEHQIELLSLQTKQDYEDLKNKAKINGTWDRVRASFLRNKAMDFVMEKATRREVPEVADETNIDKNTNSDSNL
jgi:trigger factor